MNIMDRASVPSPAIFSLWSEVEIKTQIFFGFLGGAPK